MMVVLVYCSRNDQRSTQISKEIKFINPEFWYKVLIVTFDIRLPPQSYVTLFSTSSRYAIAAICGNSTKEKESSIILKTNDNN